MVVTTTETPKRLNIISGNGEAGWGTLINQNARRADVLLHLTVESRTAAQPGSPVEGTAYIVPSGVNADQVGAFLGGLWQFFIPLEGWKAYVKDEASKNFVYDGSAWVADGSGGTVDVISNVAQNVVLGRTSAGSGDSEELNAAAVRGLLNVEDGATADQSGSEIVTAINAQLGGSAWQTGGSGSSIFATTIALSDTSTVITTGAGKDSFRMPAAVTLTEVRASLSTADDDLFTVDINENGTSILSTKLTIDTGETTSLTAATPAVISDAALADDAEISFDVDTAGTTATGLKVTLIGTFN